MVGREIPFSLGLFFLKEHVARYWHGEQGAPAEVPARSSVASWWAAELASSLSTSALTNVVAHPASVILALQQAHDLSLGNALARAWGNGGLRGFYTGFVSRTVAIAGTLTVVPLVISQGAVFGLS